jgi:hypothetical protein
MHACHVLVWVCYAPQSFKTCGSPSPKNLEEEFLAFRSCLHVLLSKKTFGDGDEFKAMRADAVMALANLVGKQVMVILEHTVSTNTRGHELSVFNFFEEGIIHHNL